MAKLSQKKQMYQDAVHMCVSISQTIMYEVLEAMVDANVSDKKIFETISQTARALQSKGVMTPKGLTRDMLGESLFGLSHFNQDWLDECRHEMEQEKGVA